MQGKGKYRTQNAQKLRKRRKKVRRKRQKLGWDVMSTVGKKPGSESHFLLFFFFASFAQLLRPLRPAVGTRRFKA
jgi:hypothetical protein